MLCCPLVAIEMLYEISEVRAECRDYIIEYMNGKFVFY